MTEARDKLKRVLLTHRPALDYEGAVYDCTCGEVLSWADRRDEAEYGTDRDRYEDWVAHVVDVCGDRSPDV
jgi:hypothetical protein